LGRSGVSGISFKAHSNVWLSINRFRGILMIHDVSLQGVVDASSKLSIGSDLYFQNRYTYK
jgi:hypothetical protein